jgi:hypothetical protein
MNDYILIEYSNSVDFGDIVYHDGFENKIYLDADVSKPDYELLEEGIENGEGEFSPTFQKWKKKYSIRFYAQEFLVDALTLMALHDNITITLRNGEGSVVKDVEVEPVWDDSIECWAEVTITFSTDYVIRKSCDTNLDSGCVSPVYTATESHDADGAGQATWEEPVGITKGTIYFFYKGLEGGDSVYVGDPIGVYSFNGSGWTELDVEAGQMIEVDDITDCVYLIKFGTNFYKIPYIRAITDEGGGDAKISAYSYGMENTFFQVQADDGGGYADVGDPQYASVFENGFVVSPGAGTFDFRILWYIHGCDYGYSNVENKTIT